MVISVISPKFSLIFIVFDHDVQSSRFLLDSLFISTQIFCQTFWTLDIMFPHFIYFLYKLCIYELVCFIIFGVKLLFIVKCISYVGKINSSFHFIERYFFNCVYAWCLYLYECNFMSSSLHLGCLQFLVIRRNFLASLNYWCQDIYKGMLFLSYLWSWWWTSCKFDKVSPEAFLPFIHL